mgnify:CR=1 FL=1
MACKYYIDGKQLTELQFKELLNNGLLDQIIVNQGLQEQFSDFEVDESVISEALGKEVGPLKMRVRKKVSKQINNRKGILPTKSGQPLNTEVEPIQRNPRTVIDEYNKANKGKKDIKLILVTKVGGRLKYGKDISAKQVRDIEKSRTNLLTNLTEGKIYMLVPSPNGSYPILLFSNFLGQTKRAGIIKKTIKDLFEPSNKKEFKTIADTISKLVFKTNFKLLDNGQIEVEQSKKDSENKDIITRTTFSNSEDLERFVLGEYDNKGNLVGTEKGLLAHVNHENLNDTQGINNAFYTDNNFITTDLYVKNKSFFNSSSFMIDAFKATDSVQALIVETSQVPTTKEEIALNEKILEEKAKEDASANNTNTLDDVPYSDKTIEEVKKDFIEPAEERDVGTGLFEGAAQFDDFSDLSNGPGEDLDIPDAKTRSTFKKDDGTLWNKEEELKWLRDKLGKKIVDENFTTFTSVEELEKYLPKQTYDMLIESRKHGRFLSGLFTKAAVHLSNNAFSDTGFHEAFHVVFNLALPLDQRLALMEEAVDKYNMPADSTLRDIEEKLADEFMVYARAEEKVKVPSSKIANFFKALWRGIKTFFGANNKISIDTIFENIQLGVYKDTITFDKTDFSKINPEDVKLRQTEQKLELDPKLEKDGFEYMEYKLFLEIDKIKDENKSLINKSDSEVLNYIAKQGGGVNRVFGIIIQKIINDLNRAKIDQKPTENFNKFLTALTGGRNNLETITIGDTTLQELKRITPMVLKFSRFLRNRGINLNLDSVSDIKFDLDEETSYSKETENNLVAERWQQAYIEINPNETLSQLVRRKLGTIQKQTIVDGKRKPVTNVFGAPTYYSQAEVFAFLGENITDSYSIDEMMDSLRAVENKKPFIGDILSFVELDSSFATSLYTTLASKTFQKFLMVYEDNGDYTTFFSNRKTLDNLIKETFVSNFIIQENKLFNEYPENSDRKGQRNFESPNKNVVEEQQIKLKTIIENAKNAATVENKNKIIKDLEDFLLENNLNITENQLLEIWNPTENRDTWNNITSLLSATNNLFEQLKKGNNPFLSLKQDKKTGYGSVLENFVKEVKPAFDKEVSAAFRNGDNKTVFSIQYSNYLNKLINKLKTKEGVLEYKERIKNDPLLKGMPLINNLLDSDNSPTKLMDKLEVVILDSLARKGKNKNVSYSDLSDIEIETVAMAAFYDSNRDYGYYKLPIPSDGSVLPLIKSKKYTTDEIVEQLVAVAQAEKARIQFFNNLKEDSELLKIPNYKDNAGKFNILSFLQGKVGPNTTAEEIKILIKEHLDGEFLELHKEKYLQAGIITKYEKGPEGKIEFADKVITKKQKQNNVEFFKNYLYNSYLMNTQMTTIFSGDPAFYKNTGDYQKRYKQIVSPGTYTDSDPVGTYKGMVFQDEFVPTRSEVVDNIIELLNTSDISEQKRKELIASWEATRDPSNDKSHHNTTDAATFISINRMEDILISLDRFTPEHAEAIERVRKGIEKPQDAALFEVMKPFMYTTRSSKEGIEVPVQIKNSEVLLTKSFAYRKNDKGELMYPKLVKAYDLLNGENAQADFIAFESAVKVGALGNSVNNKGEVVFNKLELVEGNYELVGDPNIITLDHADWRLQQETPEHYLDAQGNFGSQVRVLAISDMDMDGDYNIGGKNLKGREVAKLYQDLIVNNIRTSFEEVESMFLDENGEIDYSSITKHLKEEAIRRNLDEQYFEALEIIEEIGTKKKVPTLPLWHPLLSYKVESLMNSFFKNNVNKQKIKGGQMINATSYGVSDTLEFKIDKDGNYQMEALLPWWSKKFFPKDSKGNVNLEVLPDKLKNMIGYRIPTEDKYSIFNIKVKGFTDSAAGAQIILPSNATTQAGLDFDIDKLFMMMPEYTIDSKGNAVYKKYLDENSTLDEVVDTIVDSNQVFNEFLETVPDKTKESILRLKENAEERILKTIASKKEFKNSEAFQTLSANIDALKAERNEETNESRKKAINRELSNLFEEVSELDLYDYRIETAKQKKSFKESIKNYLEDIGITPSNYVEYNSTSTRNNKILEIMTGIMENKHTALSILDSGNFDELKEIANKTRLAQISPRANKKLRDLKEAAKGASREKLQELADQLDDKDFNINYPSTQLALFNRNMTGKKLIGVFANHNTNHAKAQFTNLRLTSPFYFNGKEYQDLSKQEIDGVRITKLLASKLAAVVDNSKDPISSYLNMNMYTASLVATMSRLGIKDDTTFAFVNQPVIKDITQKYFNEKGSLAEQKALIDNFIKEQKALLLDKPGGREVIKKISGTPNLNLKELTNALDRNESLEYYTTQYKAVLAFKNYLKVSEDLNRIVQASRVDSTAVGPSSGDNYVMLNRQSKLMQQVKTVQGFESFFFNESDLQINPAFNKYAWLKPVGIMNKIFPSIGTVDPITGEINYSLLGNIKNYFSKLKGKEFTLTPDEANRINSMYMTYLGSQLPFFDYSNAKNILEKVPEDLRKYKNNNPDSPYMDFLDSLYSKDSNKSVSVRRIEYLNTGKNSLNKELERQTWKNMLLSENSEARRLALDLVKYSYFSNGYAFGPNSFFNLIPVEFWKDSFAKSDLNRNEGLLDVNGNSFTKMLELSPGIKESNITMDSSTSLNFIRQYVQNTAENSMIIPIVNTKETREHTPNITGNFVLDADEVYVFPTTQEGLHNVGQGGFAFSGETKIDNSINKYRQGEKGKFTEYLVAGKMTEGKEGFGFGLRMQEAIIENDRIKSILDIKDSPSLVLSFINDFNKLTKEARRLQYKKFIVGRLSNNTKEVKKALKQIEEDTGIPDNIILPSNVDPRVDKSKFIKEDSLFIYKRANSNLKNVDGDFPEFVKVFKNNETLLFELAISTKDQDILTYNRIPILGTSNFVKEFNFDAPINTSILPSLTKTTAQKIQPVVETSENFNDLKDIVKSQKEEEKLINEDLYPDIDVDEDIPGIFTKNSNINKLDYSNYSTEANKAGVTPMTQKEWNLESDDIKATILDQLKNCR